MLRRLQMLLCVGAAAGIAGAAHAQTVGARIGTTGLGVEAGVGFSEIVAVRGSYGLGSYDYNFTRSDIRYETTVKPRVGLLTLDVHPFAGAFRLSAGLGLNHTRADGTADSTTGTVTINDTVYSTSEVGTVEGRVTFKRTAPYVGFGWGAAQKRNSGWYFTSDFRRHFQSCNRIGFGHLRERRAGTCLRPVAERSRRRGRSVPPGGRGLQVLPRHCDRRGLPLLSLVMVHPRNGAPVTHAEGACHATL